MNMRVNADSGMSRGNLAASVKNNIDIYFDHIDRKCVGVRYGLIWKIIMHHVFFCLKG